MAREYDLLVFIGRFQPLHLGHEAVIRKALEVSTRVLVLIGSSNRAPSLKNPWTANQRERMIQEAFLDDFYDGVQVGYLHDFDYADNLWIQSVQEHVEVWNYHGDKKIGLIGHSKDQSSYYLKLFPGWGSVEVENVDGLNSTDIRNNFIEYGPHSIRNMVSKPVYDYLLEQYESGELDWLAELRKFISDYKESVHKYPRIEHTVDAVVVQSGHVLLVQRKENPGKDLWALPGGFVGQNETLVDAMIRELREETRLKIPEKVLSGSIKRARVFDAPNRSERGRIITQAYLIDLERRTTLPKVKGSDDAKDAKWVPLNEVDPRTMFEDHYFIIQRMME